MRKRVPGAKRAGQNATENDGMVSPDLAGGGGVPACAPRPLQRTAHLTSGSNGRTRCGAVRRRAPRSGGGRLDAGGLVVDGSSAMLGRYGSDTVADALVAGWGLTEISSILRWALADLAVALLEIERRLALSSHETKSAEGTERRLPVSN